MATTKIKRLIRENGIVLSKTFKAKMDKFTGSDGKEVPAQPDRWIVTVASGELTQENGFADVAITEFKVDEKMFKQVKYLTEVTAVMEFSANGTKPKSLEILNRAGA